MERLSARLSLFGAGVLFVLISLGAGWLMFHGATGQQQPNRSVALSAEEKNPEQLVSAKEHEFVKQQLAETQAKLTEYEDAEAKDQKGLAAPLLVLFGVKITWWKIIGSLAAFLFAGRWLVQMYYSRKAGKPIFPRLYWVISITASIGLLCYFVLSPQRSAVGVIQNFFPMFVAGYNLYLDIKYHKTNGQKKTVESSVMPEPAKI